MLTRIPEKTLFKSEPNPGGFGNRTNEKRNPNWTHKNWLLSRFHFSFAEYFDRERANFGVLRVMNDDLVQPTRGFGSHPHSNMEIVTYVVDGNLTHRDSMGTEETLTRGALQFMSAGKGIMHSEFNNHETDPLRFIQIWIIPRKRGISPAYGSYKGSESARQNAWQHLVSDRKDKTIKTPVKIDQDANLFVGELTTKEKELSFDLGTDRQMYVLCVEGSGEISGLHQQGSGEETKASTSMERHDGARVLGPCSLRFKLKSKENDGGKVHFLLLEMKQEDGDDYL